MLELEYTHFSPWLDSYSGKLSIQGALEGFSLSHPYHDGGALIYSPSSPQPGIGGALSIGSWQLLESRRSYK